MDDVRHVAPSARIAIALVVVSLLLLVGCSAAGVTSTSGGSASSAVSSSKICQSLAKVNESLKQLSTIGSNTTVGEVKSAQQKLTTAISALEKLPVGNGSTLSDLKSANDQLTQAISGLPDSAPIGQASAKLQVFQGHVAKAQTTLTKLASTLRCPS